MAELAVKLAVEQLSVLPPTFDLAAAMTAVVSVKQFESKITVAEQQTLAWRIKTITNLRAARERLREAEAATSYEVVSEAVLKRMPELWALLDKAEDRVRQPLEKRSDIAATIDRVRSKAPDAARYMRKLLRRTEVVRENLVDAYEAYRDFLLGVELDYSPDARGGPVFDSADDLLAHLHRE